MAFRAKADFSEVVKAAEEASKKVGDLFSKGMSSSLGGTSFRAQFAKLDALQRRHEEDRKKFLALQSKITTREHVLELQRTGKLQEAREKAEIELDKIRAKFARAVEQRDQKEIDNLKQQRKVHEEIVDLAKEYQKDAGKFASDLKVASKEFDGLVGSLKTVTARSNFFTGISKSITDAIEGGFEGAGDKITGLAENLGDRFVSGIDVTSLTKKITSGVGKGLGKAGDSLRSLVGGKVGAGLGAIVGVIGASVGALGALVAAFIAVDKKVKEFNKDIIRTHGALSVMRLGGGSLNEGLKVLKHTVSDLTGNFGVSEEEAKSLFDTLDKGGLTLRRLSMTTVQGQTAQSALRDTLRDTYTAANMLGIGLAEYADNLTNYVNDLGMSTETVNDNFRSIAKMASESAFGTRRFYSMVVQATSGQSALNVSLDQTGDLLLRMSRIMGAKKAAEMVGGAAGDMGSMSATERIKMAIITGSRGRQVFAREARAQAANFGESHRGNAASLVGAAGAAGLSAAVATAIQNGLSNPDGLVNVLSKLNMQEQGRLVSSLRSSGATPEERQRNEEMARSLDQLILVTRGANGSRGDQVAAYGGLSAGGSLATRMAAARHFVNPEGHVDEKNRAAFENITGTSGHQTDQLLSLAQSNAADLSQMKRLSSKANLTAQEKQILKQLQETHHVKAVGGVVSYQGREITSGDELLQTNPGRTATALEKTRTEAQEIAVQTMDATVSVADILENRIARIMQNVYDFLSGPVNAALMAIVNWLPGGSALHEQMEAQKNALQQIDEKLASASVGRSQRAREMARAQTTVDASDATDAQKRVARETLTRLQAEQQRSDRDVNALQYMRSSVASGNTYYTLQDRGISELQGTLRGHLRVGDVYRAPGATPAATAATPAATAATPAATAAPTATPAAGNTPPPPPPPAHVAAANAPTVDAVQEQQEQQHQQNERSRRETRQQNQRANQNMEKLIKGKELGDGLAASKLPDAIAEADAKMRLLEGIYATGASSASPEAIARLLGGTASDEEMSLAGTSGGIARALKYRHITQAPDVHDFISQDRGGRTVITPIDRADQVMGMKAGGPIANAGGRGGGNVNISIHGGDERRVFEVVRRAIQQAGITPNRVPGGG